MTLTHYLLRSRDGLYFTGDGWAHRVHAKRYALREHAERQTFVTLPGKIHVKVVKVTVRLVATLRASRRQGPDGPPCHSPR